MNSALGYNDSETILGQLSRNNVFSVVKQGKEIRFTEGCDCYYWATLTKEEVLQLAQELIDLANTI